MAGTELARAVGGPPAKAPSSNYEALKSRHKSQMAEMADKLAAQGKKFKIGKEHAEDAAMEALRTVETQVTALVAAGAEGYWGEDKMKLGGKVRYRALLGLGLKGWGIANKLRGKEGMHQAAIGDGLIAADVVSLGLDIGRTFKEKKATAANTPAPAPAAPDNAPPPAVSGPLREIADQGLDMSGEEIGVGKFMNARREARLEKKGRLERVRVI